MNPTEQIEVYRLETICGLYSKEELIKFLDKIIEASLVCNRKTQDALHIIKNYFYMSKGDELAIIKEFLYIICEKYQANEITLEDSIYYLYNLLKEANLDNEIETAINYLSDGLFLAEQDIYGDVEDIKNDFIKFISKYS